MKPSMTPTRLFIKESMDAKWFMDRQKEGDI